MINPEGNEYINSNSPLTRTFSRPHSELELPGFYCISYTLRVTWYNATKNNCFLAPYLLSKLNPVLCHVTLAVGFEIYILQTDFFPSSK